MLGDPLIVDLGDVRLAVFLQGTGTLHEGGHLAVSRRLLLLMQTLGLGDAQGRPAGSALLGGIQTLPGGFTGIGNRIGRVHLLLIPLGSHVVRPRLLRQRRNRSSGLTLGIRLGRGLGLSVGMGLLHRLDPRIDGVRIDAGNLLKRLRRMGKAPTTGITLITNGVCDVSDI